MGTEISRALILGSAPCAQWRFLAPYLEGEPYLVLCADGGLISAAAAGLKPDFVIGDWDSGGAPQDGVPYVTLPAEKDMTDLQAAVDQALALGAEELLLSGCTGGRLDHTASNLVLLEWLHLRGGHGVIVDEDNEVRLVDSGNLCLENYPPYRYLSVLPLDRCITDVTLRGVKYPLTEATLHRGDTFSISNEPVGPRQEIHIGHGRVLVIRSERLDG